MTSPVMVRGNARRAGLAAAVLAAVGIVAVVWVGTGDSGPETGFLPPSSVEDGRTLIPVVLLDGTRLEVLLPPSVGDRIGGFVPSGEVGGDDRGWWSLDVRFGTVDVVLPGRTPVATYPDAAGNPVLAFTDGTLAYPVGSWTVLINVPPGAAADLASLLGGHETSDGFPVLDPVPPLGLRGTDAPDGRLDSATPGDALVGILRRRECLPGPTTLRGHTVTAHEPGRVTLCFPEGVELHLTAGELTPAELDAVEVR